jgi:hypothetical protein
VRAAYRRRMEEIGSGLGVQETKGKIEHENRSVFCVMDGRRLLTLR